MGGSNPGTMNGEADLGGQTANATFNGSLAVSGGGGGGGTR